MTPAGQGGAAHRINHSQPKPWQQSAGRALAWFQARRTHRRMN